MGGSRRGGRRRWPHAAWALALLCLLLGRPAAAAPGPPPLRDYAIDAWTTRNGLRHNSLRDMAQTGEGYLWFATWEGVVRYNGVEFTPFDRGTTPGLRDNGVGALYVDPNGTLWLSDSRGNLGRLGADGTWEYLERAPQWPRALVHDMAMDAAGRLWLLFENHGLGCVHPDGRLEYIAPPPGIPLPASYPRLAIDAAGSLWSGTLEGLVLRAADGRWRRLARPMACRSAWRGRTWPPTARCGWRPASGCSGATAAASPRRTSSPAPATSPRCCRTARAACGWAPRTAA